MTAGRRLVVEADGGSRGNPGPAAYGAVVRDAASGAVLAEVAEHIGVATNNVAEYRGLVAGLHLASTVDDGAELEVRMDSKLVVEQMSGRWKVKHPSMRPLALEASRAWPSERVRFRWVPREQNRAADRLANEALDAAERGEPWRPAGSPPVAGAPAPGDPGEPPGTAAEEEAPRARILGWEDPGPPTTLLLVRHGETVHTTSRRFSGWGGDDPGLSDAGQEQAERVAARLAVVGADALVTSPLRRCQETAAAVGAALGLQARADEGFREAAFGEWDGCTFAEVQQRWPEELDTWLASTSVAPPGGESLDDVAARVAVARDRTIARHPGRTVVAVSHVTPVTQLVRMALDAPMSSVWHMLVSPASLTVVQWWPDGASALRSFNDTAHLL